VYWARHEFWDPVRVALEGSPISSCRKSSNVSGNIGLHHVHHARPTIPNYNLQQCHDDIPALHAIEPLVIRTSLESLRLSLYDEEQKKLISFHSLESPASG
jgi:acyl-lipid omega-6 desaturase (Delta-12 desaturase)